MIVECPGCKSRYDVTGRPPGTRARCRCGTIFELPAAQTQAGMLACPRCGGNVAATNHTCEYCSAELLVRACPRCFARIFHGAKHCSSCGARSVVPARADADGTPARLACPRCSELLLGNLVGDVLIDECPSCYGVWVDMVALDRILAERRQARADRILGGALSKEVAAVQQGPMYVSCPECETTMNRRNFARGAGIIVDVCRSHGTWFDGGELPAVIDFVMKGGLESAAIKEAESAREDARAALYSARLESARQQSRPVHGARTSSSMTFGALLGSIGSILVDS